LVFVLALAFGLRVYRLDGQSMWWDELSTAARASLPLVEMLKNLFAVRNHVPLYFLLIRPWARLLGNTAFALRFFSVIWGLVSVAAIYRLGDLAGGRRVGAIAALLLTVSPFHIWYSQEARMYSFICACTLGGNWFLLRLLRRGTMRDLVGYGLCMLAATYAHYLSVFVLIAHYAFFSLYYRFARRLFIKWLVCAGIVGALFGIWGAVMMLSGGFTRSPIGWIAPAHWYEPALTLLALAGGPTIDPAQPISYLALGICLAAIGACLVRVRRQRLPTHVPRVLPSSTGAQRRFADMLTPRLLFVWLLVPLALTWAISLDLPIPQKRSIYMDRYLITVLPAFLTLVAWGLVSACGDKRWLILVALAVLFGAAMPALANLYFDPAYARDDWRGAMSYVKREQRPKDVLLLRPSHTLPLSYYTDGTVPYQEFPFLFYEDERHAYLAQEMGPRMDSIAQEWERAWLISSVDNTNPHSFPHDRNAALIRIDEEDEIKAWLDARYVQLEETFFTGVLLTLYDLPGSQDE
jgi:uncharacterized membrane protein